MIAGVSNHAKRFQRLLALRWILETDRLNTQLRRRGNIYFGVINEDRLRFVQRVFFKQCVVYGRFGFDQVDMTRDDAALEKIPKCIGPHQMFNDGNMHIGQVEQSVALCLEPRC